MLPDDLRKELQAFYIKPLEIHSGDMGAVVLLKVRRKMDKIINQHNKLLKYLNEQSIPQADKITERSFIGQVQPVEPMTPITNAFMREKWTRNRPEDVIDLLIQMRHTCQCVAPAIVYLETLTYRHYWCKDCNRPYLERED